MGLSKEGSSLHANGWVRSRETRVSICEEYKCRAAERPAGFNTDPSGIQQSGMPLFGVMHNLDTQRAGRRALWYLPANGKGHRSPVGRPGFQTR